MGIRANSGSGALRGRVVRGQACEITDNNAEIIRVHFPLLRPRVTPRGDLGLRPIKHFIILFPSPLPPPRAVVWFLFAPSYLTYTFYLRIITFPEGKHAQRTGTRANTRVNASILNAHAGELCRPYNYIYAPIATAIARKTKTQDKPSVWPGVNDTSSCCLASLQVHVRSLVSI